MGAEVNSGCLESVQAPKVDGDSTSKLKVDEDPASKWKEITVEMWRDAVYTNETYFGELIADTAEFVKTLAEHIKLGGNRVSLVEVGCGTGEFIRAAEKDFRTVV